MSDSSSTTLSDAAEPASEHIARMEAGIGQVLGERHWAHSYMSSVRGVQQETRHQLDMEKDKNRRLTQELEETNERLRDKEELLERAKNNLEEREDLARQFDDNIQLRQQVDQLETENNSLRYEVDDLTNANRAYFQDIQHMRGLLNRALDVVFEQRPNAQALAAANQTMLANLKQERFESETWRQILMYTWGQLQLQDQKVERLRGEVEAQDNEMLRLQEERDRQRDQIRRIQEESNALRAASEAPGGMAAAVIRLTSRVDDVQSELERFQEQLRDVKAELAQRERTNASDGKNRRDRRRAVWQRRRDMIRRRQRSNSPSPEG